MVRLGVLVTARLAQDRSRIDLGDAGPDARSIVDRLDRPIAVVPWSLVVMPAPGGPLTGACR